MSSGAEQAALSCPIPIDVALPREDLRSAEAPHPYRPRRYAHALDFALMALLGGSALGAGVISIARAMTI